MQQGEPSLEEILASIRKVMSRDEAAPAGAAGPEGTAASPTEAGPTEPVDEDEAEDVLDLAAHMLITDTPAAGQPEWTEGAPSSCQAEQPSPGNEAVRRDAASAVRESLAALERVSASNRQMPAAIADPALHALTREVLRPMLAEWLETNLPPIVERLVQAEIARIVDGRG